MFGRGHTLILRRLFASVSASSLKQGTIFLHQGKYCEVVSSRQMKQGRGSSSIQVEYLDLSNRKMFTQNYAVGSKVEKVDLEKKSGLVQYVDEESKNLVVSDHNFEDKVVDLELVGPGYELLTSGDEIQLFYHEESVVKVGLPNHILSKIKY
ncbi:elongation factor [Theileria orientalis]|uniref:Elongation factor n=1 Tax=Theileria orientalis TaxID=68886 RepID=A0A976SIH6_THEOR|nr:elongation factor [Theileria orientalis]